MLDVARVFMGEAETVVCRSQSVRPGVRGEDMATVMLGHGGGATSIVDVTYASRQSPDPFPRPCSTSTAARARSGWSATST